MLGQEGRPVSRGPAFALGIADYDKSGPAGRRSARKAHPVPPRRGPHVAQVRPQASMVYMQAQWRASSCC
jgi:hypothetical protein